MSGKGVMARKTSPPERVGSREPSTTVVPATKMRVASATEMTMAAAMTSSVSAAPADRRAG